MSFFKRHGLILMVVCVFLFISGHFLYFVYGPLITGNVPFYYPLSPGQTTYDVAMALETKGYLHHPRYFFWLGRLTGYSYRLHVGYYSFQPGDSAWHVLRKMAYGEVDKVNVTLVDGWTAEQVLQTVMRDPRLQHSPIVLSHEALLKALGLPPDASLEGLFWPESYAIYPGYSDLSLLQRAHHVMANRLAVLWAERAPSLPYSSSYEALIMASLLQKETASTTERRLMAGVLINRLNKGMRLQVDPTVIYALGSDYTGQLTHDDLKVDSPYNTYRRKGLPPTPIALPGLDALIAALHPTMTDYLYFVARGDGLHTFSATLTEQNAAVQKIFKK